MWYNHPMSRKLILVLLVAATLSGCTGPALKIATHVNNREYYYNRYIDACVTQVGPDYCSVLQLEINKYKAFIVEAEAANARGGKYPLQLKALKSQLKKVEDAGRGRSN